MENQEGNKSPFSLFGSSSHPPQKKGAIPHKAPPTPKVSEEQQKLNREKIFQDPQIKEAVQRIEKLHKEIGAKLEELLQKGGYTPKSIKNFLQNPKNFNPAEWKQIQAHQEEVEKELGLTHDPKYRELKKNRVLSEKSKAHKGKTLGGRKNWIDMH